MEDYDIFPFLTKQYCIQRRMVKISATFEDPKDAVVVIISLLHQLDPGRLQWTTINSTKKQS